MDPEELKQFHTVAKKRVEIADAIRRRPLGSSVEVLLHAIDSRVPPPMDDETREVLGLSREQTAEQIAKKWLKGLLSQENYLDKLLLVCDRVYECVVHVVFALVFVSNAHCKRVRTSALFRSCGMRCSSSRAALGLR